MELHNKKNKSESSCACHRTQSWIHWFQNTLIESKERHWLFTHFFLYFRYWDRKPLKAEKRVSPPSKHSLFLQRLIIYFTALPAALPFDHIDQRQKHQVRYNLIRMYFPFISAHMSLCPYCYLHYYIRFLFLKLLNFLTFLWNNL